MSTYVVGDVQGCFPALQCLLNTVQFSPNKDRLWSVGDMVSRGPQSLESLRYFYSLRSSATVVLGNHDLHLLALYYKKASTTQADLLRILSADDAPQLIHWLRQQPLAHYDKHFNTVMAHAGIPQQWGIEKALLLSGEIEKALQDDEQCPLFLQAMYGNSPNQWDEQLQGMERLRVITNYFTRMRFCHTDGALDFQEKTSPEEYALSSSHLVPWFSLYPKELPYRLIFGHWAALMGKTNHRQIIGLDTGCVWGQHLTLLRLDDMQYFQCDCP
jgi:bis(5'-nucleosyl)-tetraphosphatase (symmetrical)